MDRAFLFSSSDALVCRMLDLWGNTTPKGSSVARGGEVNCPKRNDAGRFTVTSRQTAGSLGNQGAAGVEPLGMTPDLCTSPLWRHSDEQLPVPEIGLVITSKSERLGTGYWDQQNPPSLREAKENLERDILAEADDPAGRRSARNLEERAEMQLPSVHRKLTIQDSRRSHQGS